MQTKAIGLFRKPLIVWIICAMLTALGVVLKMLSLNFTLGSVMISRVSFDMVPIYIAAFAFGPFMGALTGALTDILGYFIAPTPGEYNPAYTVTLLLAGIAAWGFYRLLTPLKARGFNLFKLKIDARCSIAVLLTQTLLLWPMNSLWTVLFFGSDKTFAAVLIGRIPAQAFCIIAFSIILTVLMPIVSRYTAKIDTKGKLK